MCGRFTLHLPAEVIAGIFGVELMKDLTPRFNIAPSQMSPVVCQAAGARRMSVMKWGLIPHWAKAPRHDFTMINARAETVDAKPAFRTPFHFRRCLVVADGFYEWRRDGKVKEPYHVALTEGGVMPFAGVWDQWKGEEGESVESFAIITCPANSLVSQLHERMPVIIGKDEYDAWLDPGTPLDEVKSLLRPFPAEGMTLWRVGSLVNSPKNDSQECLRNVTIP